MMKATLLALLSTLAISGKCLAQSPPPASFFEGVDKLHATLELSTPGLRGDVGYGMKDREVQIRWLYRSQGKPKVSYQNEAVSFWPTEVCSYDTNKILVSGRNVRSGASVVELWEFNAPSSVPPPSINPITGETMDPYVRVPVGSKIEVYETSTLGTTWTMMRWLGTTSEVLIQFWEGKDLYSLDVSSGAIRKVLAVSSEGNPPETPVEPELANISRNRWNGIHDDQGYVYYLGRLPNYRKLFLFDYDKDGTIDAHLALDLQQYWDLKLDDGDLYSRIN